VHVLLASQFFPPEIGAAQNRLSTFVSGLLERDHAVSVVCEQPNHPHGLFQPGFGRRPLVVERDGALTVRRVWVVTSPRKTWLRRLAFYGSYAAAAPPAMLAMRRPDVAFISSPPLPGAATAAWTARALRLPLVVDIRDVWPAAIEALGEVGDRRVLRLFERLERSLYASADVVTTTTQAFCRHIDRVAGRPVSVQLPNGAMDHLLALPERPAGGDPVVTVGYAGNFGLSQRLDLVLDAAARLRDAPVRFVLVGEGPRGEALREQRRRLALDHVEIRGAVPPEQIGGVLQACDVLLVPLLAHAALDDIIPTKIYDAMAVGRAVIASVRGEAAALVDDGGFGLVIAPENVDAIVAAVRELAADRERIRRLGRNGRAAAGEFARSRRVALLEEILQGAVSARRR